MPQLHLYLPEEVAAELRRRAEAEGMTTSKFLARLVSREVGEGWPVSWFERVVGRWQGALERPDRLAPEAREPW